LKLVLPQIFKLLGQLGLALLKAVNWFLVHKS